MYFDFYCPNCECGMNKDGVDVHEDDHIGEWCVSCLNCKEHFLLLAEASIDYSVSKL